MIILFTIAVNYSSSFLELSFSKSSKDDIQTIDWLASLAALRLLFIVLNRLELNLLLESFAF